MHITGDNFLRTANGLHEGEKLFELYPNQNAVDVNWNGGHLCQIRRGANGLEYSYRGRLVSREEIYSIATKG